MHRADRDTKPFTILVSPLVKRAAEEALHQRPAWRSFGVDGVAPVLWHGVSRRGTRAQLRHAEKALERSIAAGRAIVSTKPLHEVLSDMNLKECDA